MAATTSAPPHVRIAIVGAGFGGVGLGIRLRQRGLTSFAILERAGDLGGVWRDNTYPGCACDVPSQLYSLSFAPEANWSRKFAGSGEIHAYLRRCAERFGLGPHFRYHHDVRDASWDEATGRWVIDTSAGTLTADVLVGASGGLSDPSLPAVPGLEAFQGPTFHSARWNHDVSLDGKRVVVVGTGASAAQIVPEIQPRVGRLVLFQRTPPWVIPRGDRVFGRWERRVRSTPLLRGLLRGGLYAYREALGVGFHNLRIAAWGEGLARRYLEDTVKDPVLRAKLTPTYRLGCKRVLLSDDYLPALQEANVDVVAEALAEVRPRSVVSASGVEHEADVLVFATGFQVQDLPLAKRVRGRGGVTLAATWARGMAAHLGTTVAGFPNLFLLLGPNTGLGHTSVLLMMEAQMEHILGALAYADTHRVACVEPRPEAQEAFVAEVDRKMEGTVWTAGNCASWYLDARGRNSTLWPGHTFTFARRVEPFDPADYVLTPRRIDA